MAASVKKSPPVSPDQLGLPFDAAAPESVPKPVAAPKPAAKIAAPEGSEQRMIALAGSEWAPPESIYPREGRSTALAAACSIQNADLARQLLELDARWNLDAPYGPQNASAICLLMQGGTKHGGWRPSDVESEQDNKPVLDDASRVALAMVERGADFLLDDDVGQSALNLAVSRRRQAFIQSLAGHPDFVHAKLMNLRVGPKVPVSDVEINRKDDRHAMLSYLAMTGQIHALKALVVHAGCPINERDHFGRLPIGYCPDLRSLEALLALGADPKLEDAKGLNALARAQDISETSTREKMITRIAQEFKKNAKANPEAMAQLQEQNIAALLEAAENAPKSSMLKTISAFKFDPTKARDPKTGMTPLMAALKGARNASVNHLLQLGCSLNDVDANGLAAASRLMVAAHNSGGPDVVEMATSWAGKIDFARQSSRGWPVAVEAAFLLAKGNSDSGYGYNDTPAQCFVGVLKALPKVDPAWLQAPNGPSICEAYALGTPRHHSSIARLLKLLVLEMNHCRLGAVDRGVAATVSICCQLPLSGSYQYTNALRDAAEIEKMFISFPEPLPRAAAAMARAIASNPQGAAEFITKFPALAAAIEASELLSASMEAKTAQKRPSSARL